MKLQQVSTVAELIDASADVSIIEVTSDLDIVPSFALYARQEIGSSRGRHYALNCESDVDGVQLTTNNSVSVRSSLWRASRHGLGRRADFQA